MPSLAKITVAAPTTRLTTLANARAECDTTDDVTTLIDRASAVIASHCGRAFGLQTVTETFRRQHAYWRDPLLQTMRRARPLLLLYGYDQVPDSVTIDGGDTVLVADTDYEIDLEAGMMWRLFSDVRQHWYCSTSVVVEYQTGWNLPNDSSPNLPADIEAACLVLVRNAFNYIGSDSSISREQTEGVGLVNYFARSASGLVVDAGIAPQLEPYMVRS